MSDENNLITIGSEVNKEFKISRLEKLQNTEPNEN